jgi:seryl-tRNA synthetase
LQASTHEDFYAKNFHWKEKSERPLWSGCTGISPTRWAYVFVLRYGLDFDAWPKEIKKYIGKKLPGMPDDIFV